MSPAQSQPMCCLTIPTYEKSGALNAVIETPQNSHAKLSYDEKTCLFRVKTILPAGAVFPYNFGFLPRTRSEDGDPIDVLVMMDASVYPGTLICSRLIGVIEAEQTEKEGTSERNDRLVAVALHCPTYGLIEHIDQVNPKLLEQIENFFISYNKMCGKKFKPLGRFGPKRADKLIKAAMERFEKEDTDISFAV